MACEVEPTSDGNNAGADQIQNETEATSRPGTIEPATPEATGFRSEATVAAEWLDTNWADAEQISYNELFRNIDLYEGKPYGFTGKVIQSLDGRGDSYQLRISVTKDRFSWSDTVYVFHEGIRILEDDLVQFVATVEGTITYKSVLGGDITIPELKSDWLKVIDESEISSIDRISDEASVATDSISTSTSITEGSFGDGIWAVGSDIQPGTYLTTGSDRCTWRRISGFSGESSEILAIENPDQRAIVEILESDTGFSSGNCGDWIPISELEISDPLAEFSDGTWRVGEDILPGIYKTAGSERCSWRRLKSFSGGSSEILAIANPDNRVIVQIHPSDIGFKSIMCGIWTAINADVLVDRSDPATKFDDGVWRVGFEIVAGTYFSRGSERCSWRRLSGFSGDTSDLIAIENPDGNVIVEILTTDIGFNSIKCGSWELISSQEP